VIEGNAEVTVGEDDARLLVGAHAPDYPERLPGSAPRSRYLPGRPAGRATGPASQITARSGEAAALGAGAVILVTCQS
jgi:hypothetical protein